MSDREAFVSAIAANPDDDLPRLVFADWLDENGDQSDQARALFIRTQIRWHHAFPEEREELDIKASELFREHGHRWFGPFIAAMEPTVEPTRWFNVQEAEHPAKSITLPNPPSTPTSQAPAVRLDDFSFWVSRGFVSEMRVVVSQEEEQSSLAEAFRQEPLHLLRCWGGLSSQHWRRFTDPCLRQVNEVVMEQLWSWNTSAPESSAFLEDPHLSGVRHFTIMPMRIEGGYFWCDPLPVAWVQQFVRSPLASRLTGLNLSTITADGVGLLCQPGRLHLERIIYLTRLSLRLGGGSRSGG